MDFLARDGHERHGGLFVALGVLLFRVYLGEDILTDRGVFSLADFGSSSGRHSVVLFEIFVRVATILSTLHSIYFFVQFVLKHKIMEGKDTYYGAVDELPSFELVRLAASQRCLTLG